MISVLVKNTFVCWVLGRRDLILLIIRKEPENHRKSYKINSALKKYSCSSVQGYSKAGSTEMSDEDHLNQGRWQCGCCSSEAMGVLKMGWIQREIWDLVTYWIYEAKRMGSKSGLQGFIPRDQENGSIDVI